MQLNTSSAECIPVRGVGLRAAETSTRSAVPEAVEDLRKRLRGELFGYEEVESEGSRVSLFDGDRCVATGTIFRAEQGVLPSITGLQATDLSESVAISEAYVEPRLRDQLSPVLMYLLLRRGRIWDRHSVMTYLGPALLGQHGGTLNWQRLSNLSSFKTRSSADHLVPVAQRLDIAIHRAYQASGDEGWRFLRQFFVPEAVETLEIHIDRFFKTEFFRAVFESTLSREQYIYSMSNLHQFVRYTTRLIGRAVSLSSDEELRNHWLSHLSGEINHEKIIEKDLEALGVDVEYVRQDMVPNVHNQAFMVAQESAIAFYQDPVLFMAAPFSAEGWTARLDERFMDALHKAISSWGVQHPRHVTGFLASHIRFDGGDDGHWEASRKILGRYLDNDQMLQRFVNLVHLAMGAFERSYSSYVTEQRLWSALPAHVVARGRAMVAARSFS